MKPNIAIIGTGAWGKNLARNLHQLGALGWAFDSNSENLHKTVDTWKEVKPCQRIEEIINEPAVQAVVIASPAETHYEMAKAALNANKHVFVEKPLALHLHEAQELHKLANDKKLVLMVGHILLYHPAILKLKEMILQGELGNINYIYSNRLNLGKVRKEENILWSFAPHDISVLLYLLDSEPEEVLARGAAYLQPNIHDVTMTTMKFPKNIMAHIFVSWLHPFKEQRLVVIGDRKMVVFEDSLPSEKLKLYDSRIDWIAGQPEKFEGKYQAVAFPAAEPLLEECKHFIDCIASGKRPRTDGANGIAVLSILERASDALLGKITTAAKPKKEFFVHDTAFVDANCRIGKGSKIWHFSHIQSGSVIGEGCTLGQNVNVANNVIIGNYVKIQNNVSVYEGVELGDYVFCGPSMVFTNILEPRSEFPQRGAEFYLNTKVGYGASIGANATIVCGHNIGRFAFIAAGAVIAKEVPEYALMAGVPAKRIGWMSRHGARLPKPDADGIMVCPKSGWRYREVAPEVLKCLDWPEDKPAR